MKRNDEEMEKAKQMEMAKKVHLAWKKWNDSAVKKAEKEVIKATIEKLLSKYSLTIDWKTGNVTVTGSKQTDSKQKQADSQQTGSKKKASMKTGMTTKDLIQFIFDTYQDEWTGKNLRRKIRQMEKWNDGKMTHYDFTPQDIKEILTHLGYKAS